MSYDKNDPNMPDQIKEFLESIDPCDCLDIDAILLLLRDVLEQFLINDKDREEIYDVKGDCEEYRIASKRFDARLDELLPQRALKEIFLNLMEIVCFIEHGGNINASWVLSAQSSYDYLKDLFDNT